MYSQLYLSRRENETAWARSGRLRDKVEFDMKQQKMTLGLLPYFARYIHAMCENYYQYYTVQAHFEPPVTVAPTIPQ